MGDRAPDQRLPARAEMYGIEKPVSKRQHPRTSLLCRCGVLAAVLVGLALSGCAGSSKSSTSSGPARKRPATSSRSSSPKSPELSLVAIGDSIPYNSPDDCPGCTRTYRPQYDRLFSQITRWRRGKPTILRTIDRYNDWTGYSKIHLTPAENVKIKTMIDTWDAMLCASATAHGFVCADIYHAFNGPDGRTPSGSLVGADYTHPSNKGNALIAKVLISEGFAPSARSQTRTGPTTSGGDQGTHCTTIPPVATPRIATSRLDQGAQ